MAKPKVILDPSWRRLGELFAPADLDSLRDEFDVIWAQDAPMPGAALDAALEGAFAYIAATPRLDAARLAIASGLRAVIEVSGAFPDTIDYDACDARGVEVLSCAPGFRQPVAEMALAMTLGGARGLFAEHEAFRRGEERWLEDYEGRDFSLYGASVGFVGYGQIAREIHRLITPFGVSVRAYDPWLDPARASAAGVMLLELDQVMQTSRCLFVTAAPTTENKGMIDAERLAHLPDAAMVVLVSRAHLVDFDALLSEVATGRIRAAIDVFPTEPLPRDHSARNLPGLILSPHRAAAVEGGRQLIGRLILDDLRLLSGGQKPENLQRAHGLDVSKLAGTGNATEVEDMAGQRS